MDLPYTQIFMQLNSFFFNDFNATSSMKKFLDEKLFFTLKIIIIALVNKERVKLRFFSFLLVE